MASTRASADPLAEKWFRDGRKALKDGHRDEACELFQRSEDREKKVGTLLNLADCREHQGRIASAWDDFLQAKSLAIRENDNRASEAARRAATLEPRLSYVTIEVPEKFRTASLAVSRNGVAVATSELNAIVPLDPGTYTIEARATGFVAWSRRIELAEAQRAVAAVELVVDPNAKRIVDPPPPPPPPPPVAETGVRPAIRRGSLGLAFGVTSDAHVVAVVRGSAGWPVPHGAVRIIITGLFSRFSNDPADDTNFTSLYAFAGAVDYLYAWRPGIAAAFGLGSGIDIPLQSYSELPTKLGFWIAPRVSPIIFRLARPNLELGLHLQFQLPDPVLLGTFGVDWFW